MCEGRDGGFDGRTDLLPVRLIRRAGGGGGEEGETMMHTPILVPILFSLTRSLTLHFQSLTKKSLREGWWRSRRRWW